MSLSRKKVVPKTEPVEFNPRYAIEDLEASDLYHSESAFPRPTRLKISNFSVSNIPFFTLGYLLDILTPEQCENTKLMLKINLLNNLINAFMKRFYLYLNKQA